MGAAAAPVFLVGSADVWRFASKDDVAARAVSEVSFERNGVDVLVESAFAPESATTADAEMVSALSAIAPLATPRRTTYTFPGLVTLGPPPLRTVGPAAELVAADGALAAVDVVDQLSDTSGGIWITTWYAERHDIALGDGVAFEAGAIVDEQWNDLVQGGGADAVLRVVGVYDPLWSDQPDQEIDPFWSTVPPEIVPRYIPAFDGPNRELFIVDESTLLRSGLTGAIRWGAPLTSIPDTFDDVGALAARFQRLETDLVGTGSLGDAMAAIATTADRRPILTTDFPDTARSARAAADRLEAPLDAARGLGGVVGLAAAVAVGAFFVERRRTEFRLLAGEGKGALGIGGRVVGQLILPFLVGGLVGVGGAVLGPRWYGPADRIEFGALRWTPLLLVGVASLVVAVVTAAVLGARTLRTADRDVQSSLRRASFAVLVVLAAGAWVQVGRTSATGNDLDLVVVALPVLAILLSVALGLTGVSWVMRRDASQTSRLPTAVLLAVRRLARGSTGVRFAAGALGLGIGLLVFAAALTATLDRTVDVKLATEIGGVTSVALVDDLPPDFVAPAPTTVVRTSDTMLTPGDVPTRIIAIDPDTFANAVNWPTQFGADIDVVMAQLRDTGGESIPMVGVSGEPAPAAGAFGITRAFQYRVVDRIAAFPAAGNRSTSLLASAAVIDEFAATRNGYASIPDALADGFPLPVAAYRRVLITQAEPDAIVAALDDAEVRYREVVSQQARRQEPAVVATRAAFSYLGVIGIVALTSAMASLVLFLSARRRVHALTRVMTQSMGMPAGRSALVSAIELAVVLAIAVAGAFAAVPLVVRRLSARFDPAPARPPDVPVLVSWAPLVATSACGALLICVAVWWLERRASRRPAGEVLRDGG